MKMLAEIEITPRQIADQMTTAFESPLGCWLGSVSLDQSENDLPKDGYPWYYHEELYQGRFAILIRHDDPKTSDDGDHSAWTTITERDVDKGLKSMADKAPYQFSLLRSEDGDAITADVFLQHVLFGEEIYG